VSPQRLVHIVDRSEVDPALGTPVMLVALDGFLDAGNASALALAHLGSADGSSDPGKVVASFEVDELHDYRARRPPLTFQQDHYTDYDAPRLVVREMTDSQGTPYLLLTGPEPDVRWEAFARAVREVLDAFEVRLVVSLGSVPMAVPHTRPVQLTNHATAQRLLVQRNIWSGEIRVPSSAQSLLELRLGEWGHDATGFVAHIPHYLAQFDYPQAALALVEAVERVAGLQWEHAALEQAAEARQVEIATQIADSPEVREVVAGLEQQYDAFAAGTGSSLLSEDRPLPSGDELGAQFEQFLAGLDRGPESGADGPEEG
jgi:hypothetical protein